MMARRNGLKHLHRSVVSETTFHHVDQAIHHWQETSDSVVTLKVNGLVSVSLPVLRCPSVATVSMIQRSLSLRRKRHIDRTFLRKLRHLRPELVEMFGAAFVTQPPL